MELNDNNYSEITKTGNWLICFYYSWCKPCHKLNKILTANYRNDPNINLGFVNLDECPRLLKKKNIHMVPTLHIISNSKFNDKIVGLINAKKLKSIIDKKYNKKLKK